MLPVLLKCNSEANDVRSSREIVKFCNDNVFV